MVWKGLRGGVSKTYSGIDFDIAKSALQKYTRRGIVNKAVLIAVELYRLKEVGGNPGVTNMHNRIAIMAAEDIGVANLSLTLEVIKFIESGEDDIYKLLTFIQLMCESKKTRIMSHYWRAYANTEGREVAIKHGLKLDTQFSEDDINYINENINCNTFNENDPTNLRYYILMFMKRLLDKDVNAYSWAYFYLEVSKDVTLSKRKKFINGKGTTGKADILLWKVLSTILDSNIYDILVEAYYNHTESRPFLQLAILVAIHKLTYSKLDTDVYVKEWKENRKELVTQMLSGTYKLEVDDFVIDKHTAKGRNNGKTVQDFVDEGAIIIPQAEEYYDAKLEEIYKIR